MKIITMLYAIILVFSIFLAVLSSYHFITGFHNIDTGQNLRSLNAKYGLNLVDTNSLNEQWSGSEMYVYGQTQIRAAFFLLGISVFFIGFSLKGLCQGELE